MVLTLIDLPNLKTVIKYLSATVVLSLFTPSFRRSTASSGIRDHDAVERRKLGVN